VARFLGGLRGPTDRLEVGLRDVGLAELAGEDPFDDFFGPTDFLLLAGEPGVGDGAVRVAALL
jgi:hypothetical protein